MTDTQATPGIGHNLRVPKPASKEEIQADLAERHADMVSRGLKLQAAFKEVPEKIEDKETCGKAQEVYKMTRVYLKSANEARKIEAEPYTDAEDAVIGFFKKLGEPFDADKAAKRGSQYVLNARIDAFLAAEAERERLRKEEEARKAKEEADRQLELARQAEAERLEAQRRREEEEKKAEQARLEKERAVQEARDAEARAAELKEKARIAELERKEREAREKREEAEREAQRKKQKEIDDAAAAQRLIDDAKRKAEQAEAERLHMEKMAALKKEQEEAEAARVEARRKASEEQAKAKEADEAAKGHRDAERAAQQSEKLNMKGAERNEKIAERNQAIADDASDADLARNRSDHNVIGTRTSRWVYRVLSYDDIPLERLRPYLNHDAIDAALHRYMTNGGREMPGVVFEREQSALIV